MSSTGIRIFLWALPFALSAHVTEEFAFPGGFVRWIELYNHRRLKGTRYYVVLNGAAIIGSIANALLAKDSVGYWLYLYTVALLAGNAVSHLRAAFQQKKYCPGSVTGGLLLIPLLLLSSWQFITKVVIGWPFAVLGIGMGLLAGFYVFPVDARPFDSHSSSRGAQKYT